MTTATSRKVAVAAALLLVISIIPAAPAFADGDPAVPEPPRMEPVEGATAAGVDDSLSFASSTSEPLPTVSPLAPSHNELQLATTPDGTNPVAADPVAPEPSSAPPAADPAPTASQTPDPESGGETTSPLPTDGPNSAFETPTPTAVPDPGSSSHAADPSTFTRTVPEPGVDEEDPAPIAQPVPAAEPVPVNSTGITVEATPTDNAASVPTTVTVDVLSETDAAKHGLTGLVLQIARSDGHAATADIAVTIPDTLLDGYYGADFASRARWVTVPAETAAKKVAAASEIVAATPDEVSDTTTVSPQISSAPLLLTLAATPVSSTGTGSFAATSLKPSSSWDVSAQTGGFSWSLPLRTPPAAAGPSPSLALNYDSQSVDGETASTNNQPSAIGEGWSLGGGGFIERSYVSCSLDGPTPVYASGDLCWKTDNATLNLAGHSGLLVRDATTGVWKLQNDDGSRIEYLTGTAAGHCASNGTWDNDCWRLTTTDGTQYYFGLNNLPGWSSGKASTNSAWTVPVFGNDAGEACHQATFEASSCMQGWRWNLDYIVDTHDNAEALYYAAETNAYTKKGDTTPTSYIRGGQLEHIEYGLTATTVYTANAATDKVLFGYDSYGRCNDTSHTNCTTETITSPAVNAAHPTAYPDVPFDQFCTTACTTLVSPSFWTTGMLNTITTQARISGAYSKVDEWTLGHSFPAPGDTTSPALWLTKVGHTGYSGSASITEHDTTFDGASMQNRVWVKDGLLPLDKWRVSGIHTSSGAIITVNYQGPNCNQTNASSILAHPESNTLFCFPQWWTPTLTGTTTLPTKQDLFHKYVVASVVSNPNTGGGNDPAQQTDYSYGTPAWRYDKSPLTPSDKRTWSDYAGVNTVQISTGNVIAPAIPEKTQYTFYQGMDGDQATTAGGTKSVAVTGFPGVTDSRWFAGHTRDVKVLNGSVTVSDSVTSPWASSITANDGTNTAWHSGDGTVTTTEPLSTGGNRTITTTTTYDNTYGYPLTVNTTASDLTKSTCTKTDYATPNTAAWIIGLPKEILKVGVACSNLAAASYPADAISQNRITYDAVGVNGTPTKGDPTLAEVAGSYNGGAAVWLITATNTYDTMGRLLTKKDVANHTTTTTYTPAAGAAAGSGALTSVTTTNTAPYNWTTTTNLNPAWGAETSATDENGEVTTAVYDALGRRTDVWLPGRPQASNPTASIRYRYTIPTNADTTLYPLAVATTTLVPGSTVTSYTLYDGLGQQVQTQTTAEGGGTAISDLGYNKAGRVVMKNNPYFTLSVNAGPRLFVPTSEQNIQSKETTSYDGAGRPLVTALVSLATERYHTTYAYPGADRVDTLPPAGAPPTSVFTNTLGQETKLTRYSTSSSSATPFTNPYSSTYEYNVQGKMTKMTDAATTAWLWEYDTLGRQTKATDPDTGTTTSTYDDAGNLTSSTDARNITLAYTYDNLNRKTGQYVTDTSSSANLLASWAYDTAINGKNQLASSSSYTGSGSTRREYKQSIISYDDGYRPLQTTLSIPAGAPGFTAAKTYSTGYTYYPNGSLATVAEPAIGSATSGGMPAENIAYAYGAYGHITGIYGTDDVLSGAQYTPIGAPSQYTRDNTYDDITTFHYDQATLALDRITDTAGSTTYADRQYTRDNAGNITSAFNTGSGFSDKQCYTNDLLGTLQYVWTTNTTPCASGQPWSTGADPGPNPYWKGYFNDPATGNRSFVMRDTLIEGPWDDYTYPAATAARPHAVQSVKHYNADAVLLTTDNYTYDASGNTLTRPGQTLTYSPTGKIQTLTAGAGSSAITQTNVYTADGSLLLQTDPTHGTTVFAGDTEIHVATGSNPGAATAVRTYNVNGTPIAERTTKAGTLNGVLRWLSTDIDGTADLEIGATDGTVTHRLTDPYGNPRSTPAPWSSSHTFLNAPSSELSNLVQLGARAYDPTIGKFLTVDPVLAPFNPAQNNGYAYASNNPVTLTDPSGLCPTGPWANPSCKDGTPGNGLGVVTSADPAAVAGTPPAAGGGSATSGAAQSYGGGCGGNASYNRCSIPTPSAAPKPIIQLHWGQPIYDSDEMAVWDSIAAQMAADNLASQPAWIQQYLLFTQSAHDRAVPLIVVGVIAAGGSAAGATAEVAGSESAAHSGLPQSVIGTKGATFEFANPDHTFRPEHNIADTQASRDLLQSVVVPNNFIRSYPQSGPGGGLIEKYAQVLPDGTQAWVEVRGGNTISNGGINIIPKER
ncbi:RHS repeat-associated core domain-containing protein [Herbiconiux sp. 11R-BC]|uniref:RHS repeat-associated core domain-containing protein n=1 Tax=Herbiconiux sp. 11R-BC TaxID=3111637 RepID=UPI003C0A0F34